MTSSGGDFQSGMPSPSEHNAPNARTLPASLATAIKLMYVGAALSLLSVIVSLFQRDETRRIIEKANAKQVGKSTHLDPAGVDKAVTTAMVFGAIVGLLGVGLWILMAQLNKRGLGWARIVSSVLAALSLLTFINAISQTGTTSFGKILAILTSIVGVAAGVFLWRKDNAEYYKAHS